MSRVAGIVSSFIVVALQVGLIGCNRTNAAAAGGGSQKGAPAPVEVTTVKPQRTSVRRTSNQPAYIAAFEETPLYAKISGYAYEPRVDIGDSVLQGQVLVELWVPEMVQELKLKESLVAQAKAERVQAEAGAQAAEAAITTAGAKIEESEAAVKKAGGEFARWKSQLEREEQLAADRTIQQKVVEETRNQLRAADAARDEAAAKVKSAKAGLKEAEAKLAKAQADVAAAEAKQAVADDDYQRTKALLAYARIGAPFDGLVTQRNVDTGHFVPASGSTKPLFIVVRMDPVRVFLDVPEKDATSVQPGQPATIRVEALGGELFQGTVTRVGWTLDPNTRTMRAEIDVPNPNARLRPGMYAYADIVVDEHSDVLTIPTTAVIKQGDKTLCCCVIEGKAIRKPIRIGLSEGTVVEVLSGLSGQEDVVSANAAALSDGQTVQATAMKK